MSEAELTKVIVQQLEVIQDTVRAEGKYTAPQLELKAKEILALTNDKE